MRSLEGYLSKIYTDFEHDVAQMDCLCAMTSLNYQTQSLPKYTDIHVQQLYLLKYAYAYAYEYFLMYNKAIRDLGISGKVSVTSLGCGAMVDYMGLVSLKDVWPLQVSYTGIDQVDWNYKPIVCAEDKISLHMNTTAAEYFKNLEELGEDIYIFPKSISELSMPEVADICNCFRFKKNTRERFSICVSLRNSQTHLSEDWQKTELIQNAVTASGYTQGADNARYYYIPEDCGIKRLEKNYGYPNSAANALKELGERCRAKHHCGYQAQCQSRLNRQPVLRTREICYRVMTFFYC